MSWSFLELIRSFKPRRSVSQTISMNDAGLILADWDGHEESNVRHVLWNQISNVYAYKLDLLTYDMVRLAFCDGDVVVVHVDEERPIFEALIQALPEKLPSCLAPGEWWDKVALPPFETNWTELYRRPR